MRYDIGEYGLTRDKVVCWASMNGEPIHYLWYVWDSSEELKLATYEDALEHVKEKMRADKESGRMDECLKEEDGHIIIYFTAGWDTESNPSVCNIKMHISAEYGEDILNLIREYDDRIVIVNP